MCTLQNTESEDFEVFVPSPVSWYESGLITFVAVSCAIFGFPVLIV